MVTIMVMIHFNIDTVINTKYSTDALYLIKFVPIEMFVRKTLKDEFYWHRFYAVRILFPSLSRDNIFI